MEDYELKDAIPTDLSLHKMLQAVSAIQVICTHQSIVGGAELKHVAYTHLER